MIQKSIQIKLESGLEARPVAMLVQVASQFESTVYLGYPAMNQERWPLIHPRWGRDTAFHFSVGYPF